jgi:hypothetical protein
MYPWRKIDPPDGMEPEEGVLWFYAFLFGWYVWQITFPWFGLPLQKIWAMKELLR